MKSYPTKTAKRATMRGLAVLLFANLAISLGACSKVHFSGSNSSDGTGVTGDPTTPGTTPTCQVTQITVPAKILFLVDESGSNADAQSCYNGRCYSATDPSKQKRYGALKTFVDTYSYKSNFSWGFIGFAGQNAFGYTNPGFTNSSGMYSNLSAFYADRDNGNTPYHAAFQAATNWINADKATASADTKYIVVLISDGLPTDYNDQSGTYPGPSMRGDIINLTSTYAGHVTLSSIYYGSSYATDAISLLSATADIGGGQFKNAADVSSFRIDDVISGGTVCQ